jgi:tetratricopeptide (TPR) repeat protein
VKNLTLRTCALALVLAASACQSTPDPELDWFDGGALKPTTPQTLQLTARVLAARGDTTRAGYLIERLLRDHPDHLGTYTEGAEILLSEGRIQDAIGWLDRGLARFPAHPVLLNDRGLCHLLAADLAPATLDFEAACAADPADAEYVSNLALARALGGEEDAARELWARVLTPADVNANLEIARASRSRFAASR